MGAGSITTVPLERARASSGGSTLDHESAVGVWGSFLELHQRVLDEHRHEIADDYLEGLSHLSLTSARVPSIHELQSRLMPSGWSLVPVDAFLSPRVFFEHLSMRRFPVIMHIRTEEQVGYSPVPDFIHDVLGHLPLLHVGAHARFVTRLAESYLHAPPCAVEDQIFDAQVQESALAERGASDRALEDARMLVRAIEERSRVRSSLRSRLRKLYLWTVEFGFVTGAMGAPKVVGAGILSSHDELVRAKERPRVLLTNETVLASYDFTQVQLQYLVFEGWEQLESLIPEH
ncbi:hypothetical protein [Paraliomyxa miuraensis]|uniref:hypothetical protein n=1 Tax=Paraliomyxa miuraensis TaxID=376150 RepID=UPI002250E940|nr:hypothetical protein [Paraliomyxa miuraensis]MCX4245010.1 hypothetical protein [Paraliomyxa miuraensis]